MSIKIKKIVFLISLVLFGQFLFGQDIQLKSDSLIIGEINSNLQGLRLRLFVPELDIENYNPIGDTLRVEIITKTGHLMFVSFLIAVNIESIEHGHDHTHKEDYVIIYLNESKIRPVVKLNYIDKGKFTIDILSSWHSKLNKSNIKLYSKSLNTSFVINDVNLIKY